MTKGAGGFEILVAKSDKGGGRDSKIASFLVTLFLNGPTKNAFAKKHEES